ncbi:MAG: DUF2142 domain-containing protein [Ardenticatenia bacterium]|nr:DUF2142 domain-containing protein [Ardenticatenia bacterium]
MTNERNALRTLTARTPTWARSRRAGLVLFLLYALVGLGYIVAAPIFEKPDENGHFFFALHLARGGGLPVQNRVPLDVPWGQEGSQAPLYYWLASILIKPFAPDVPERPPVRNPHAAIGVPTLPANKNVFVHPPTSPLASPLKRTVYVVRGFSLVLGALVVWSTWRLGTFLLPSRPDIALVAAAWLGFTPQFLFIASSVSNDVAVAALATLVLVMTVRSTYRAPTPRLVGAAFVLGGALALSKLNGVLLVPLATVALVIAGRLHPSPARRRPRPETVAVALVAGVLVGAGWWYWRNWTLYGEPTGISTLLRFVGRYERPPSTRTLLWHLSGLWLSFWGVFGWFNLLAPEWWYRLLHVLVSVATVGGVYQGIVGVRARVWARVRPPALTAWGLVLVWPLVVFAGVVQWTRVTYGAQGRLLFPALSPLFLVLAVGLATWIPRRRYALVAVPALGAWILFAAWVPWGVIRPAYALPPHGPEVPLPTGLVRLGWTYGPLELMGYTLSSERVEPGTPLDLSLYWRAKERMTTSYSISAKVFGYRGQLLAQDDGYPGRGNYPTRFWEPEEVVVDVRRLRVTSQADVPVVADIWVDVYRYDGIETLPARDEAGNRVEVPRIARASVASPPLPQAAWPRRMAQFEEGVALAAAGGTPTAISAGDPITITLTWLATAVPSKDYTVFVHVVPAGQQTVPVVQADAPPRQGFMPTAAWRPGDLVPDTYTLHLPVDVPPGMYDLLVGLYEPPDGRRLAVLASDVDAWTDAVVAFRLHFNGEWWQVVRGGEP